MVTNPSWLSEQDAAADEAAWRHVCADTTFRSPESVCRAARHHNWRHAPIQAQGCTYSKAAAASRKPLEDWINTCASPLAAERRFVTHTLLRWHPDPSTLRWFRQYRQNPDAMPEDFRRNAALAFVRHRIENTRPLWLADEAEMENLAPLATSDWLERVASLGLFGFLPITTEPDDAILAIVFSLRAGQVLHQPDWRHGYPSFYFAAQPQGKGHGLTRDLRNGQLVAKEWVLAAVELEDPTQLKHAQVGYVKTAMQRDSLPALYWQALGDDIAKAA